MGRYLTDAGYANIAPLLGEVTQVEADGASTVLAVVQGYVHNQGDAWSWTLHLLARAVQDAVIAATSSSFENRGDAIAEIGDAARTLGKRLGEIDRKSTRPNSRHSCARRTSSSPWKTKTQNLTTLLHTSI